MDIAKYISNSLPEKLYHYTSREGLLGIIRDKEIWASNLHCLNDATEFKYAIDLASKEIEKTIRDKYPPAFLTPAYQPETSAGVVFDADTLNAFINDILSKIAITPIYVFSLSCHGDQLSQWRAYCECAKGYSIGFNVESLKSMAEEQGFSIAPCVYDPDKQKEIIREMVNETIGSTSSLPMRNKITQFVDLFWKIAPILKHPAFAEEKEWRLFSPPLGTDENKDRFKFRNGNSLIIPYVCISLASDRSLAIAEIYVGPTPIDSRVCRTMLRVLFSAKNLNPEIHPSNVPYRSW